jgi:hypothetical protein
MDLIQEHNNKYAFFRTITGEAMRVYGDFILNRRAASLEQYLDNF